MMDAKEFQKALTKEAFYLRGLIITGYSLIEYILADISVRLDLKFPYRIKDRIKAAKKIVDRPDYEAYRHDFHRACDELLRYDEIRNFMAHGILFLTTIENQTSHKFTMRLYERCGAGKFRHQTREFSIEDLRTYAGDVLKYTDDAYAVFHKFYLEQAVETFVHPKT